MAKNVQLDGIKVRAQLGAGVSTLRRTVATTLGPGGRNVFLDRTSPLITKDGVTVAREVDLGPGLGGMGVTLVKEAAQKAAQIAGDGTTSTTILAEALFRSLSKRAASGYNPVLMQRGLALARDLAMEGLDMQVIPVTTPEEVEAVATICSNGDQALGGLIATAVEQAGREGIISVEEGESVETVLEWVEGYHLDRGTPIPLMIAAEPGNIQSAARLDLKDVMILVANEVAGHLQKYLPILEYVKSQNRPLIFFAHDVTGDLMSAINANATSGLRVFPVKLPRWGDKRTDIALDICALTGAWLLDAATGTAIPKVGPEQVLGGCPRATFTSSPERLVLFEGYGSEEALLERSAQVTAAAERSGSEHDKEFHAQRASQLTGGMAVIRVGAHSQAALKEYRARVEDALSATRAAVEGGLVAGGATSYLQLALYLRAGREEGLAPTEIEALQGWLALEEALEEPFRQLHLNAGNRAEYLLGQALDLLQDQRDSLEDGLDPWVWDMRSSSWTTAFEAKLVDPALVIRQAVIQACSVAGTLATVEAALVIIPNKEGGGRS
jgi:chaperonin GroEL